MLTLPLRSDLRDLNNLRVDSATTPLAVSMKIKLIVDSTKEVETGLLGDLHDDRRCDLIYKTCAD